MKSRTAWPRRTSMSPAKAICGQNIDRNNKKQQCITNLYSSALQHEAREPTSRTPEYSRASAPQPEKKSRRKKKQQNSQWLIASLFCTHHERADREASCTDERNQSNLPEKQYKSRETLHREQNVPKANAFYCSPRAASCDDHGTQWGTAAT